MSPSTLYFYLFLLFSSYIFFCILQAIFFRPRTGQDGRKLPPGPRPLPIIGNLHMLGNLPHQTLCQLAQRYGPIMSIRLVYVPTIIVSSPQAAELFLKTHDNVFASRPQASKLLSCGTKAMSFTEYGPYWRNVRKLCSLHLLSSSKIESFGPLRAKEVGTTVEMLRKAAAAGEVVDVGGMVGQLIENITYKMIVGKGREEGLDLKENIQEMMRLAGAFNIADFVPFLAWFDIQGLAQQMKTVSKLTDRVLEKILEEHERDAKEKNKQQRDFVDVLLSLLNQPMNPHDEHVYILDRTHIKAILLDMIAGAFETSATAIEWILSELLRNPQAMERLQDELKRVVGMNKMLQETDLSKLTYLDMVIKETLRLHPVSPLLVPHESMEDITIQGYHIPRKSRVMVNIWAIGRDPDVWSDNAGEFLPERFEGSDIDLRGHDFRLIPFGSGLRGCPGMQLGLVTVQLVLAQLVHCFDWELPDGMSPKDLDMSEKFCLTMPRAKHLFAKPRYRLCC